jgi:hypothetical protein
MRSRSLVALAIAVAVVPAVVQAAESATDDPGEASFAQDLRESVRELGNRARAHATRLGLRPAAVPVPAPATSALRRQERRLREVLPSWPGARRSPWRSTGVRPRRPFRPGTISRAGPPTSTAARRAWRSAWGSRSPSRSHRPPAPRGGARSSPAGPPSRAGWRTAPSGERVPYYDELTCIAEHESGGRWDVSTGNGYHGGLQMDRQFQQTYAPAVYEAKGTADNWTKEEQMRAAARAVEERGFTPWSTTARMCGLLSFGLGG